MANPLDYLAAPVAAEIRKQQRKNLSTPESVRDFLGEVGAKVDLDVALDVLRHLASLNLMTIIDDQYAGTYYRLRPPMSIEIVLERLKEANPDFTTILGRGSELWRRVFANEHFWADVSSARAVNPEQSETGGTVVEDVPASDRIVTVTHNQYEAINSPLAELEGLLERDNGVPDEPSFRERILGHLRAGRELLRSGYVEVGAIQFTLLIGLKLLAEKYREHAIGAMASALLTLVLHELGIPGF